MAPEEAAEDDWLSGRHRAEHRGLGLVEILADMLKSILEWEPKQRHRSAKDGRNGGPGLTGTGGRVDCFESQLRVLRGGKDDEHPDT